MNTSENIDKASRIRLIFQKTWGITPVLIGAWWVLMIIYAVSELRIMAIMIAAAMLAIDCAAFRALLHNSDRVRGIHCKRAVLLVIDIFMCIVFGFFALSSRSDGVFNFFLLVCPPLLFIFNIATYAAEEVGGSLFRALIFTDPLFHYMMLYLYYLAAVTR